MPDDSSVLTLKSWRKTSNGDVKGDVYGHSNHEDGATVRIKSASIISNDNILEHEGYLLPTLTNHNYRLGKSAKTERQLQRLGDIANPIILRWRKTDRGDLKGDVYNHPEHNDGDRITVKHASIISNENILELEGNLLFSLGTHNNFRLGRPMFVFEHAERRKLYAA